MPRAAATPQPGAVPKRLMSLAEFLSNYSVSRSEFYRLCAKGAAPAICKIGRKTLVPFDAAEEWLQARIRPASELCRAAAAAAPPADTTTPPGEAAFRGEGVARDPAKSTLRRGW